MKHAVLFLVLSSVVLLGNARDVRAAERVGVVVSGDTVLQSQVVALLETWLRDHAFDLVASPLPPDAVASVIDCFVLDDESCARKIVDTRAIAPQVVVVRLQVSPSADGSRNVELTGFLLRKQREPIAERRFCEKCNDAALGGAADRLMAALMSASAPGTGYVTVTTTPSNAKVLVDDKPAGVTPLEYELAPGTHTVSIMHDGGVETRTVAIRAGETTSLDVPLATATPTTRRPSRTLPAALLVVGAATLATGIVMIAIDEDPSPTGPLEIRNTGPTGVVLASAGGVLAAVGAVLWFQRRSTSRPAVAVGAAGGVLGWSVSF